MVRGPLTDPGDQALRWLIQEPQQNWSSRNCSVTSDTDTTAYISLTGYLTCLRTAVNIASGNQAAAFTTVIVNSAYTVALLSPCSNFCLEVWIGASDWRSPGYVLSLLKRWLGKYQAFSRWAVFHKTENSINMKREFRCQATVIEICATSCFNSTYKYLKSCTFSCFFQQSPWLQW